MTSVQATALFEFQGSSRYLIERELGQGGMGVVYQALDRERGTRVALKAISKSDALNIYRLKNEFRQLADISHPNLVSLHELVYEGDKWFFTMELVHGRPFDEYLGDPELQSHEQPERPSDETVPARRVRALTSTLSQPTVNGESMLPRVRCDTRRLRAVLCQLVEGIAALHNADKLHRDIKPSNVLITPAGRVVILDFGLVSNGTFIDPEAQDADRTVGGSVFGTPAYMSPEQAVGEPVTTASDWYSLGAMVFEVLTGELPFEGSVLEILRQKEESEPPAPSELASGVPDDLDQLCRALLRRQPSQRPEAHEILQYLTGVTTAPPTLPLGRSLRVHRDGELFVGRERHLDQLHDALESLSASKPVVALIHGVSGMGKSALARCFANELIKGERAVVLRGRCYERESVPYKAFDNVIDALSRYMMQLPTEEAAELLPRNIHSLAKLFPVLRRVRAVAHARRPKHQTRDPHELRNQAFEALKDLLLRISDYQPLVVQIDDLQWGDSDSARLLLHLLGSPNPPPILFMGVYRRDEADNSPFLRRVLAQDGLDHTQVDVRDVPVDALRTKEAEHLTRELLRDYPSANALFAQTIAAEAEGIPFFIAELVQHTRTHNHESPIAIGKISLEDVIMARVGRMPPEAQALLETLSVAARPLEQAIALQAAQLGPGDRNALLSLRAVRLIRTRGTRQTDFAEIYHDRVRETVVARMAPERVRQYHARIAEAIEAWGIGDPERLVEHYAGAGNGGRAGETAVEAARAAADKLAFSRAAQLFHKALDLLPSDAKCRPALLEELGDALANSGRSAKAAAAYLQAADHASGREHQKLKRAATQQMLRGGQFDEARPMVEDLLRDVGLSLPASNARAKVGLVWNRARLKLARWPDLRDEKSVPAAVLDRLDALGCVYREIAAPLPIQGTMLQTQYLLLALKAGEPHRILEGLCWDIIGQATVGGPAWERRSEAALEQVVSLADRLDTPRARGSALMAVSVAHMTAGRFREALEVARQAEDSFRACHAAHWDLAWLALSRNIALEFTGDFSETIRESAILARKAAERDDRLTMSLTAMAVGNAYLAADDPEGCERYVDEQAASLGPTFTVLHHLAFHRKTESILYRGYGRQAYAYVRSQWQAIKDSYVMMGKLSGPSCHHVRARAALAAYQESGDLDALKDARNSLTAAGSGGHCYRTNVLGLEGTLAATLGNRQKAEQMLRAAMADLERDPESRNAICASYQLGLLLGGAEGQALIDDSARALREQGIVRPDRWVALQFGHIARPTESDS